MANEGLNISAKAQVTLTKFDAHGNIIGTEEHEISLTEQEAKDLWHLQQQE